MGNELLQQQATEMSATLPRIMRRLFTLHPDDPSAGLTLAQVRVCTLLSEGPLPMSAVGKELGVSLSALTQITDRLERANLVERIADQDDRRVRVLNLTPLAATMLRERGERRIARVMDVIGRLPIDTREQIVHALRSLEEASEAGLAGEAEASSLWEDGPVPTEVGGCRQSSSA